MDTGSIAWAIIATALVLFMTPGVAFFYGGLVKAKSVVSMMMMSFGALGLTASTPDELRDRLDHGFASDRPTVIHLRAGPMPDPWPHFLLGRARGASA